MKKNTLKLGITFILAGYLSIGIAAGQGGRDLTDLSHLFWKSNITMLMAIVTSTSNILWLRFPLMYRKTTSSL